VRVGFQEGRTQSFNMQLKNEPARLTLTIRIKLTARRRRNPGHPDQTTIFEPYWMAIFPLGLFGEYLSQPFCRFSLLTSKSALGKSLFAPEP
jgi:hypothetical protein